MAADSYHSLSTVTEGFLREKASKFYAFAYPVASQEEVEQRLAEVAKQFHDARHVCYAWRLGPNGEPHRANDAGEPAHSAGTPILNELRSKGVSDALCVVVRYFGGTKLGVGGLIQAYGAAAKDALDKNPLREVFLTAPVWLGYPYSRTAEVNRILHQLGLKPVESHFLEDCRVRLDVPLSRVEGVRQVLREAALLAEG